MQVAEIYCEGFHDRAFLAGWLLARGWKDPRPRTGAQVNHPVTGAVVAGGRFLFVRGNGSAVEIVPCHGRTKVLRRARERSIESATKPLDALIIAVDHDGLQGEIDTTEIERRRRELILQLGSVVPTTEALVWAVSAPPTTGVPAKQTLERVVCAALAGAYPDRAKAVAGWLTSRPDPLDGLEKAHSWSYMAGWYSDSGCERFLTAIWDDAAVRSRLEAALAAGGLESIVLALE